MPISQLLGLPISGWLASKIETRWQLVISAIVHAVMLFAIGIANSIGMLILSMFIFAFFMRILNIAMNAQALILQKEFKKRINGSFHGMWSFGGIAGIGLSTLLIALDVSIEAHLLGAAIGVSVIALVTSPWLIRGDRSASGNKLNLDKPDLQMLLLGMLVLFAAVCEGGMFDWSGVYFQEVVQVEIFTAGYLIFMTCMALTRFISDVVIKKIGMRATYLISSLLMVTGMLLAVIFPYFWPAMIGFSLVGIGTSSIFPMTFFLTGTSKRYSPSVGTVPGRYLRHDRCADRACPDRIHRAPS